MPDAALSAAIAEAYASAPVGQVVHHTLELWHATWAEPIRVVRDEEALDAVIEDGAPRNAGEEVTFSPYAFDLVPPDQTAQAVPECVIEIDNVGREVLVQLDAAILAGGPIELLYRQYLSDTKDEGPETDPPLALTVRQTSASPLRIRLTAGFPDLVNLQFPSLAYDLETFPGLQP